MRKVSDLPPAIRKDWEMVYDKALKMFASEDLAEKIAWRVIDRELKEREKYRKQKSKAGKNKKLTPENGVNVPIPPRPRPDDGGEYPA